MERERERERERGKERGREGRERERGREGGKREREWMYKHVHSREANVHAPAVTCGIVHSRLE